MNAPDICISNGNLPFHLAAASAQKGDRDTERERHREREREGNTHTEYENKPQSAANDNWHFKSKGILKQQTEIQIG